MIKLFEKTNIGTIEMSNRFIRSATWEGMATDDGKVTGKLIDTMTALANGGVGLIITGHTYVRSEGQASFRQLGIDRDERIDGLRKMTDAVHESGGKIVMQISHAGNYAIEKITGTTPFAVSVFNGMAETTRMELSVEDIRELVMAFSDAAIRAKKAGFDGIQLHSAHGYLLSQFMSPFFNRRRDEYGGNIKNRTRIHREIFSSIRKRVGDDFPIMIKMNSEDFFEEIGLKIEDSVKAGQIFAEEGFDAIELSGGTIKDGKTGKASPSRPGIISEDQEAYFSNYAKEFKKTVSVPLSLVGGIRSIKVSERLVEEGVTDFISMCRPFIMEPGIIKRWREGDLRKSECVSDNLCFKPGLDGKGIYCTTHEKEMARYRE